MVKKKTDTKKPQKKILSKDEIFENMLTISQRKEEFIAYILQNKNRSFYTRIKKKKL